jgi:hypothetical protein
MTDFTDSLSVVVRDVWCCHGNTMHILAIITLMSKTCRGLTVVVHVHPLELTARTTAERRVPNLQKFVCIFVSQSYPLLPPVSRDQ